MHRVPGAGDNDHLDARRSVSIVAVAALPRERARDRRKLHVLAARYEKRPPPAARDVADRLAPSPPAVAPGDMPRRTSASSRASPLFRALAAAIFPPRHRGCVDSARNSGCAYHAVANGSDAAVAQRGGGGVVARRARRSVDRVDDPAAASDGRDGVDDVGARRREVKRDARAEGVPHDDRFGRAERGNQRRDGVGDGFDVVLGSAVYTGPHTIPFAW